MRFVFCLAALASFVTLPSPLAAGPLPAWQDYQARSWTTADGLPQSHVRALAQTADRHIWLATDGGLATFDGFAFASPTWKGTDYLPTQRMPTMLVDRNGRLWIGVAGGAGLLGAGPDRADGLQSLRALMPPSQNAAISSLQARNGDIWLGTWWGPVVSHQPGVQPFERPEGAPAQPVWSLSETGPGTIWLGTQDGLYRHEPGTAEPWVQQALGLETPTTVRALATDATGALWIGTAGAGLLRLQGGQVRRYTTAHGLPNDAVLSLFVASDGVLWIGTQSGFARLADETLSVAPEGLVVGHSVLAFAEDHEQNIWVGTQGGVTRLSLGAFSTLPTPPIVKQDGARNLLLTRDGTVWIATTGKELAWVKGSRFGIHEWGGSPCASTIKAFWQARDGTVWAGGERGAEGVLCRLSGGTGNLEPFALSGTVRTLGEDVDGTMLVGFAEGLAAVVEGRIEPVEVPSAQPPASAHVSAPALGVWSVHADRAGALWLGTNRGVHRRQGATWEGPDQGLPAPLVYSIHEDARGTLWFGAFNGLIRYASGRFRAFGRDEGVAYPPIFRVLGDGDEHLVLCTQRGVLRVSKRELDDIDAGRSKSANARLLDAADGLPAGGCDDIGAGTWNHPDGRLLFPSDDGVVWFDSTRLRPLPPPRAVITVANLDGTDMLTGKTQFAPGAGELRVSFAAPSFFAPERTAFRYRLEPLEREDSFVGRQQSAHYAALPPGDYRFVLSVRGADGAWSRTPAVLAFTLQPHWHQRRIAHALGVLALLLFGLAIGHLIHRVRVRQIKLAAEAVANERGRMARELHDSLAQGLTGISVQLENAALRMDASPARARESLNEARALVRTSLSEARRAVWNLRQPELASGDLAAALALQVQRAGTAVPVRFQVNGDNRRLPEHQEQNLVRIVQESLTNAVRHAQAGSVVVELTFEPAAVKLSVRDDGVGFAQDEPHPGHFGVTGMKERAQNADIDLQISSRPGGGTEVRALVQTK